MKTGQIITFYSYKGGVGRTMALVNIAAVLTQWGKKVLMIDWDLEAPGIEPYFSKYIRPAGSKGKGIIDVLTDTNSSQSNWIEYVEVITLPNEQELHLLNSGKKSTSYHDRIRTLDVEDFYKYKSGFKVIEKLRDDWKSRYDFVLIDSRTGITDNGGICTIQLPDAVVLLLTTNDQSLEGTKEVIDRANSKHQSLPFIRQNITTLPIVSRFDNSTEFQISQEWITKIADYLKDVFDGWLPAKLDKKEFIEKTKIPYIPYFSFGEKISVLEQGVTDPSGMGYAYESIASIIANGFESLDEFLVDRSQYISRVTKGLDSNIDLDRDNFSEQILNSNSFDGMLNIYKEAVSKNKISIGIVNTLIERSPNFEYAQKLFFEARDNKIQPNEITFNALINKAPNYELARIAFDDMRRYGLRPSEITFNALINKAPNYELARMAFDDMRHYGFMPSEITFNALINKAPNYELARMAFDDMRRYGFMPSEITFNALINKAPNYELARIAFDDMRRYGFIPNEITFNALINKAPNYELARMTFDDMRHYGFMPSEITFNALINKAPNYELARMAFDDMRHYGFMPSEITFNALINKAPNYELARMALDDMRYYGIEPNEKSYLAISKILSKSKNFKEAEEFVLKGIERYPFSTNLYLELARLYQQQKYFEKAIKVYEEVLLKSPKNKIAIKELNKIKSNQ